MEKSKDTLNEEKLKQFFEEETLWTVHEINPDEEKLEQLPTHLTTHNPDEEVIIIADVEYGPDPDQYREEYGVLDYNRGSFRATYEDLHPTFFKPGDYQGEIEKPTT